MNTLGKVSSLTVLLGGLAMSGPASATDNGFYVGLGAGQALVGDLNFDGAEGGSRSFDGDDIGFKAFAGFNFAILELVTLGVEGGYVDFGKADDGGVEVDSNGFDAFGVAGVQLGPIQLFGKAGVVAWDADASDGDGSVSDDGTDPAYGIGAGLQFGSIGVRAEYEYFDIDVIDDVSLISVSALWVF
jgi:opacity protein-like surface antigen